MSVDALAGVGVIASLEFHNYKVLRRAKLPLSPLTLLVGPNGSGKSTALAGLGALWNGVHGGGPDFARSVSVGIPVDINTRVRIVAKWSEAFRSEIVTLWASQQERRMEFSSGVQNEGVVQQLQGLRQYALIPHRLAEHVSLQPALELNSDGFGLAVVLDRLRDQHPERFEELNRELARWLPEFDRVLFDTPGSGVRAFLLRIRNSRQAIPATELSEGTLLAVAILTLAYLPTPPRILTIEEPDRGVHPRLLRDVQDALYRLAFPQSFGDAREPVQVIATTHSPYFLDLFRDHPEQVVIAHKDALEARFERLSERADIEEILGNAPLGEVWYSGVLGGVPAGT